MRDERRDLEKMRSWKIGRCEAKKQSRLEDMIVNIKCHPEFGFCRLSKDRDEWSEVRDQNILNRIATSFNSWVERLKKLGVLTPKLVKMRDEKLRRWEKN